MTPTAISLTQLSNMLKQFRPGPSGPPLVVLTEDAADPVTLSRTNISRFVEDGMPRLFALGEAMRRDLKPEALRPVDYRPLPDTDDTWTRTATFFRPSDGHLIRVGERARPPAGPGNPLKLEQQYRMETGYGHMSDRQIIQETELTDHQVTTARYAIALRGASLGSIANRFGYRTNEGSRLVGDIYRRLVDIMISGASATVGMVINGQGEYSEHRRIDTNNPQDKVITMGLRFKNFRTVSVAPLYRSSQAAGLNNFKIQYAHPDDATESLDFSLDYSVDRHSDLPAIPEAFLPLWQLLLQDYTG